MTQFGDTDEFQITFETVTLEAVQALQDLLALRVPRHYLETEEERHLREDDEIPL